MNSWTDQMTARLTPWNFKDKVNTAQKIALYMLDRVQQTFHYEGLPDTIPQRNLELYLQLNGNAMITKAPDGKLYAFTGGLGGEPNPYYEQTLYTVANPALNFTKAVKIGEEGVLMRNDALMVGLAPMIMQYCTLIAENFLSVRMSEINTRVGSILNATTDSQYQSAKQFLSAVEDGDIGVILNKTLSGVDGVSVEPYSDGGRANIIQQQIELHTFLVNTMFSELGLPKNETQRREYVSESEQTQASYAYVPLIDNMLECRQKAVEEINEMFGTSITVEKSSAWALQQEESDHTKTMMELDEKTAEAGITAQEEGENDDEPENETEHGE